jgi:MtN3 and saliva related transmembrane protein
MDVLVMGFADIIGFTAGVFTSINIIPQIILTIKTKKVEDISIWMFLIYDLGLFLWVSYGFIIQSYPVMIMDGLAFLTSMFMTYMKIRYSK